MRHILIKNILKRPYKVFPKSLKKVLIDTYIYTSSTIQGAKNIQNIGLNKQHNSVCVLGNGPSLKKDKEVLKKLINKQDFICVNNFCDDSLYIDFKPKAYIFLDPYFFSQEAHPDWVIRREKTFKLINEKTYWPMKIIVPHNADMSILKKYIKNSKIQVVKVNTLDIYQNKYNKLIKYLFDFGIYGPPKINVLIYGIYLAIIANYKTINVFGADLSFHNDVEVNQQTNELFINFRHFNEKDKIELLKKNPDKVESFRMSELLDLSARTFAAHDILYNYAEDKGIKVINHSSFSLIDAYPRAEI